MQTANICKHKESWQTFQNLLRRRAPAGQKYCDRELKLVVVVFCYHVVCDRFDALRLPVNEAIRLPCALLLKKKV